MRFSIIITLALVIGLPITTVCSAVEREAVTESDEEGFEHSKSRTGLGFETESRLKTEPAGKSFFFLTNEIPWPEKQALPAPPPRPAAKPAVRKGKEIPEEAGGEGEEVISAAPQERAAPDTMAAKASGTARKHPANSADNARPALAVEIKKSKPAKKPAVALPDIERLLADVRRSAQPKLSTEIPASRPSEIVSAAPPVVEVEQNVDMDALVRDLEKLQKADPESAKKPAQPAQIRDEPTWWMVCLAAAGGAGTLFLAMSYIRKRRQSPIRPQSQIDAETRAFFSKLMKEQGRRATAKPKAPPHTAMAAPNMTEPAPPVMPEDELAAAFEPEESQSPAVFLLPPELAEESAYKEVVKLAAMGENPRSISEKLNLGEGEVRLVLDIARLSRDRLQTA